MTFRAIKEEAFKDANLDTLKLGLANYQKIIVGNFATDLNYTFITAKKKIFSQ